MECAECRATPLPCTTRWAPAVIFGPHRCAGARCRPACRCRTLPPHLGPCRLAEREVALFGCPSGPATPRHAARRPRRGQGRTRPAGMWPDARDIRRVFWGRRGAGARVARRWASLGASTGRAWRVGHRRARDARGEINATNGRGGRGGAGWTHPARGTP